MRAELTALGPRPERVLASLTSDAVPPLISAVVEETLRYCSHSIGAIRKVTEPFAFTMSDGTSYVVPKDYFVGFPLAPIARDPAVVPFPLLSLHLSRPSPLLFL